MDTTPFVLDRSHLSISRLDEQGDDRAYWWSKNPAERLAALEYLRQVSYGYHAATDRLQRVLTVAQLGES